MKKWIVVLSLLITGNAFAFGLPSLGGGDADTSVVMSRADSVKEKVGTATLSLAEGLADVLELSGKSKEAVELREVAAALKADKADFNKVQALSNAIGVKQKTLSGIALQTAIPAVAAQGKLPSALYNLSSAVTTDLSVSKETASLAQDIPKVASSVKNPIKLKELSDATGAMKFVASQIIPQAETASTLVKELKAYASAKNIALK